MGGTFDSSLMARRASWLVAYALSCSAPVAFAYPTPVDFDGTLSRWHIDVGADPVTYEVLGSEDDVAYFEEVVDLAAEMWNEVPTAYVSLRRAADDEKAQISLYIKSSLAGSPNSAGFAFFDEQSSDGPSHCRIEIVADAWTSATSFGKTALHELGHCLGLGHSLVPVAIMSYSVEKNSFALATDDMAAVSRLYPIDGSDPQLPPGCAVAPGMGGAHQGLVWLLLVAPLVVTCLGEKRRRTGNHPSAP